MALSVTSLASINGTAGGAAGTANQAGAEDRFLKLLVAQMQNQDPLNPMDNAQVTSQMAQIQSVNGIEKLNRTVESLGTQFAQMNALQGASLVGRDVIVPGNRLAPNDVGLVQGGFELDGPADRVQIGGPPRRFEVVAPMVKDAWTSAQNVVLGAARIRRTAPDK